MSLTAKTTQYIKDKYPDALFFNNIIIQDDGDGPYVKYWFGEPIPTEEELTKQATDFVPPDQYPSVDAQLRLLYNDRKYGTDTFVAELDKFKDKIK